MGLCACSVSQHVAKVTDDINKMYAGTLDWSQLPEREITWHQALALMRANNLALKDAEEQVYQSERQARSVYTDMIPGVSYYGFMTRSISRLADPVNSDELSSRINVTFGLPALTHVPYRVYASNVYTFAAIKAKEGRERELISKLYKLVRSREIEVAKRALEDELPDMDDADKKEQLRTREVARQQEDEKYWNELANLLGCRDARWHVLPKSMPHVRWEDYEPRLERLGELVACELALRLERARLSQYGVAINYLPTINTSLYSPSLFSSSGGLYEGTFLNGDDTTLDLSISYTLDTTLNSWNSYQQSKSSYEREKLRVLNELMEHRTKVRSLRTSMKEYARWRNYMNKRLAYVRASKATDAETLMERSKAIYSMRQELISQETRSLEAEAAVVLEYGMPDAPEKPAR